MKRKIRGSLVGISVGWILGYVFAYYINMQVYNLTFESSELQVNTWLFILSRMDWIFYSLIIIGGLIGWLVSAKKQNLGN